MTLHPHGSMTQTSPPPLDSYTTLIHSLLEQISQLPPPLRHQVEQELRELLQLLEDVRAPRFMLIGRRGTGKSSLINAIFNAPVAKIGAVSTQTGASHWYEYQHENKKVEILDTRGLQEGGRPSEADPATNPEASILLAVRQKCPDAVLFLCKAKEVDSAIQESLDIVEHILGQLEQIHDYSPPIVGILTQCDELDPPDILKLPTQDQEKNRNIATAMELLEKHLKSRPKLADNFVGVVPTVAFVRFQAQNGNPDPDRDLRWNIDRLTELLVEELPQGADLAFARLARVRKFQKKIASNVVNLCCMACSTVGAAPLPLPAGDFPILTLIQVVMIVIIAYISGRELSIQTASEFFLALGVNVGAGLIFREVARGLVKLCPAYGNVISAGIAGTGTQAIGQAAIAYFIDGTPNFQENALTLPAE